MAIRVALQHRTTYRFDRPVTLAPHEIRLRPAPHCRTPILGYSFNVAPDKHFLNWQQDPYGNSRGWCSPTSPTGSRSSSISPPT
jgi:transglutaminase-like putative cysteine protease